MSLFDNLKTTPNKTYLFMSSFSMDLLMDYLEEAKENNELTKEQADYTYVTYSNYKKDHSLIPDDVTIPEEVFLDTDPVRLASEAEAGIKSLKTNRWACLISHMNPDELQMVYSQIRNGELQYEYLYDVNDPAKQNITKYYQMVVGSNVMLVSDKPFDED